MAKPNWKRHEGTKRADRARRNDPGLAKLFVFFGTPQFRDNDGTFVVGNSEKAAAEYFGMDKSDINKYSRWLKLHNLIEVTKYKKPRKKGKAGRPERFYALSPEGFPKLAAEILTEHLDHTVFDTTRDAAGEVPALMPEVENPDAPPFCSSNFTPAEIKAYMKARQQFKVAVGKRLEELIANALEETPALWLNFCFMCESVFINKTPLTPSSGVWPSDYNRGFSFSLSSIFLWFFLGIGEAAWSQNPTQSPAGLTKAYNLMTKTLAKPIPKGQSLAFLSLLMRDYSAVWRETDPGHIVRGYLLGERTLFNPVPLSFTLHQNFPKWFDTQKQRSKTKPIKKRRNKTINERVKEVNIAG